MFNALQVKMTSTDTSEEVQSLKMYRQEKRREFKERLRYLDKAFVDITRLQKMLQSSSKGRVHIDGDEYNGETLKQLQAAWRHQLSDLATPFADYGKKRPSVKDKKPPTLCLISDQFAAFVEGEVGKFPPAIEKLREKNILMAITKGKVANGHLVMSLLNHYITLNLKGENKRWRDNGVFKKYFGNTKLLLNGKDYTPEDQKDDAKKGVLDRLIEKGTSNYSKTYTVTEKDSNGKTVKGSDGKAIRKEVTEDDYSGNNRTITTICNMFRIDSHLVKDDRALRHLTDDKYIKAISLIRDTSTEATSKRKNAAAEE